MVTAKEFRQWQASLDHSGRQVKGVDLALAFGVAPETISRWRANGIPDGDERRTRLAMAALSAGLNPWGLK